MQRHAAFLGLLLVAQLALGPGCTTRARARAEAERAFRAGEQRGSVITAARDKSISFTGPVANPLVPWADGLTLARAILAAKWTPAQAPRSIVLKRGDDQLEITPGQLLSGNDIPLEPGDVVELLP